MLSLMMKMIHQVLEELINLTNKFIIRIIKCIINIITTLNSKLKTTFPLPNLVPFVKA